MRTAWSALWGLRREMDHPDRFVPLLRQAWSIRSSSLWTAENPAAGQCGVTSLVLQDIFGGDILFTRVRGRLHFYNRINEHRFDLTTSQFESPVEYEDLSCTRDFVFTDCTRAQYKALKDDLDALLSG